MEHHNTRRAHRKRYSLSKLSTDTYQTLPEYTSPRWSRQPTEQSLPEDEFPSDRPPDYSDSAEEADADTEDSEAQDVYIPQPYSPPTQPSPRRPTGRRPTSYRRRHSSQYSLQNASQSDPFLDTLLERSVHALEMSNALLRSSISTQTSLSTLLSPDTEAERALEVRARNLSTRIGGRNGGMSTAHDTWMDRLDEISRDVEGLLPPVDNTQSQKVEESPSNSIRDGFAGADPAGVQAISQSLPTSDGPAGLRHRRKPSLLDLDAGHLQLARQPRNALIAPAPRALTQYVGSTANPEIIILPSTLGLRASGSSHSADWRTTEFAAEGAVGMSSITTSAPPTAPPTASWSTAEFGVRRPEPRVGEAASQPEVSDQHVSSFPSHQAHDTPTPAYNLLSSLAKRSESATPPPTHSTARGIGGSFTSLTRRGSSSTGSGSVERRPSASSSSSMATPILLPSTPTPRIVYITPQRQRRGSASTSSTERGGSLTSTSSKLSRSPASFRSLISSPDRSRSRFRQGASASSGSDSPAHSITPRRTSPMRPMTPPIEELSASSESSDQRPTGFRTVQSLRRILDDHPSSVSVNAMSRIANMRPPSFMPTSPAPQAVTGESTATASISRLYTKGRHSLSTRAPSPPARSSLKMSTNTTPIHTQPATPMPSPSPSTLGFADRFGSGVARVLGGSRSGSISGRSTPRRISFIEVPPEEGGPSGRNSIRERRARRRSGSGSRRKGRTRKGGGGVSGLPEQLEDDDLSGWIKGWFKGTIPSSQGVGGSRYDGVDERVGRGWGASRPGFGTMDDWAV
ncbi:hypothetical protein CONPUDRAFT_139635 [Coniophora puteana RWD-64-598 SS2]|uniref:Uncharacterized protein n=1 Tax=Coniophora puteana (strain RWD-64-598) TaxID=741705 RepID=A0A5M3MC28_CONPW|nr:uncharacterized protein CONPUDRAFT_139635 [Coniophora puteana RWD-64-598 SS2]EIW76201.1 hypothetical protein CONPUDRAFT_139635 [Coniophora puteana RWD-64-598 SS2]